MSQVDDIKTEFETIANAQVGVNTFKYEYPWTKNVFLDVSYPVLMLHTITTGTVIARPKGFKAYNIVFGVYDNYLEAEKATIDRSTKQDQLETLGIQFLEEFDNRSSDTTNNREWIRNVGDTPTTEWIENMGDMQVYAYEVSFVLQVPDECTVGTFNF